MSSSSPVLAAILADFRRANDDLTARQKVFNAGLAAEYKRLVDTVKAALPPTLYYVFDKRTNGHTGLYTSMEKALEAMSAHGYGRPLEIQEIARDANSPVLQLAIAAGTIDTPLVTAPALDEYQ